MGTKQNKIWGSVLLSTALLLTTQIANATISGLTATSDSTNATYRYSFNDSPSFFRVFLDTDRSSGTGFVTNGIGADFLIENSTLYKYSGSAGAWGWTSVGSASQVKTTTSTQWTVSRVSLRSPSSIALFGQTSSPVSNSGIIVQTLASTSPTPTPTPSPTPAASWVRCATEGGVCSFSGTRQVRYGANNVYAYQTATSSIACNNSVFGDPVYGVTKYCDYASSTTVSPTPTPTPSSTPASIPTPTPTPVATPTPTPTPVSSSGPVYYVSPSGNDANSGSSSAPWRTIQKAANTVVAGSTVILMDGTYEEPSISMNRSGTASAPIVFKAQHKWMATLASTSGCNPGFSINASYITLQDFRLSVSSRNANCTTYTSANVHVRAWESKAATPSSQSTGSEGFVLRGMKVEASSARSEGVKSNQDYTIFENNELGNSLELFNNRGSIMRGNVFLSQGTSGISIFAKGGLRNAQIYNNIIHNKTSNGTGILIGGYSCDTCHYDQSTNIEAYNTVAYNNVVINESGGAMSALGFQGAKDSAFYNNVVINGVMSMTIGGHNSGPQAPTSNPTFKNNIFVCSGGAVTSGYFGWSYTGTLNVDYNNFYNCTSTVAQAHAIVGNPMFVNQASDWHLQAGSPAINSGIPASMPAYGGGSIDISRDKDGVVRSSPWDLGIYNAN